MPVDLTLLEPEGLQVHIRLNSLLSRFGFFRSIGDEQKKEFDDAFEQLISQYLPYED